MDIKNVTDIEFIGEVSFETGSTFDETETTPTVPFTVETPDEIRFSDPENPDPDTAPDADDPAIYIDPDDPGASLVIGTFKDDGLRVYDLAGEELESLTSDGIRYNNVDIAYGVEFPSQLAGETSSVDLAIASDRANDTLAIFAINPNAVGGELPGSAILTDVTSVDIPESIFGVDDGEATAYGLATYTSLVGGKTYVFVSQADGNKIAQLELLPSLGAADELTVSAEVVRTFEVPIPEGGELEDAQGEGMVVDRETGDLYLAQEEFGIWKVGAEPNSSNDLTLVDSVEQGDITAGVEGLTIYYGEDGNGYLIASSQGDNTFAIYDRAGSNSFLKSFAVEEVEESDGVDVTNLPLGDKYPAGLLVVQDGSNEPEVVFPDPESGEIQNFNTNFKFVSLADFSETFVNLLSYDPTAFDPRKPEGLINDTELFDNGLTAFQEYSPLLDDQVTSEERKLDRFNTFGSDAATYVLDTGEFLGDTFTGDDPELAAVLDSLPIAPDGDNIPNDKDDFVEQAVNDTLLNPLSFDPIGLDNNLPQGDSLIDAELLQGDYLVSHTYGWTEFDLDAETQQLRVTTFGVDAYTEEEILADPSAINALEPTVVSKFIVNSQSDLGF